MPRIGIFLIAAQFPGRDAADVLRETVAYVRAAEDAGFDSAWIAEHHFMSYGVCPSAITLAAFALGRTSRIEVGTAVSVLSTQHPVAVAEQAALLDQVSGGRFRLGVGRGGPWVDLEVFGTGLSRLDRFGESLDLLCAALRGGRLESDAFRPVSLLFGTAKRPVVACTSEATVRLAAERGLPMLLGMHIDDEEKARMIAVYSQVAPASVGHVAPPGHVPSPSHVAFPGHVAAAVGFVGDSTPEAVRELEESLPRWLEPGLAGYVPIDDRPRPQRDARKYAEMLCRIHPVGSPSHCIERIQAAARTGVAEIILMVEGAGNQTRTLENIARLGAEVLPFVSSPRVQDSG